MTLLLHVLKYCAEWRPGRQVQTTYQKQCLEVFEGMQNIEVQVRISARQSSQVTPDFYDFIPCLLLLKLVSGALNCWNWPWPYKSLSKCN